MTFEEFINKELKDFGIVIKVDHIEKDEEKDFYRCYDDFNNLLFYLTPKMMVKFCQKYSEYI
jgi:hypothetical protein